MQLRAVRLSKRWKMLVDFGMDAGKDIFVAILIYSIGRFIIRQISILIAKVLEKRKIEVSVQTFFEESGENFTEYGTCFCHN